MKAPATRLVRNGYKTIRTLHCSSTWLGYMKPSTPGITRPLSTRPVTERNHHRTETSSHCAIEAVVHDLGVSGHVRLQNLDAVRFQKLVDRVVGILEVGQLAGAGRGGFATGREEPLPKAAGRSAISMRASPR